MKLSGRDVAKALREVEINHGFRFLIQAASGDHIYQITTIDDPVIKDIFGAIADELGAEKVQKPEREFDFDALYELFPKKIGKKKGIEICRTSIKTEHDYIALRGAILRYKQVVFGREQKFIKQFDTFMRCWEDFAEPIPGVDEVQSEEGFSI